MFVEWKWKGGAWMQGYAEENDVVSCLEEVGNSIGLKYLVSKLIRFFISQVLLFFYFLREFYFLS